MENVTEEEILAVFDSSNQPVLSTPEVSEQLSLTERTTYSHLWSLQEDNKMKSKKIDAENRVWWTKDKPPTIPRHPDKYSFDEIPKEEQNEAWSTISNSLEDRECKIRFTYSSFIKRDELQFLSVTVDPHRSPPVVEDFAKYTVSE